jgi:DNA-binding IclR family transcriptional regulator
LTAGGLIVHNFGHLKTKVQEPTLASSEKPYATSIERAFAILEVLDGTGRGWNISEMSRKLRIPKSSAHVIVLTLERLGYIKRDPGSRRYQLGLKICGLGRGLMKNLALPEIALPHMRWLVDQTRLTAHLAILERNQAVYIQKVDGPGVIKFDTYVGKRADLHCTAVGKVLLAYAGEEFAQEILSVDSFPRYTNVTITSAASLGKELSIVRKKGYSVDDEEEELGVRCLGTPVLNSSGKSVAALSVTGTISQIRQDGLDSLADIVKEAAARVSGALQAL